MQLLVQFKNIRAAYALADYLNVLGIACRVIQQANTASLYIEQSSDIEQAKVELQAFINNPSDEKYRSASWQKDVAEQRPPIGKLYQSKDKLKTRRWQRTGIFTKLVIGICAVVFLITAFGADRSAVQYFFFFSDWGQMGDVTQFWRWITPVFLHFGILHFTFNLLWWWDLASLIERLQGSYRLVSVFLALAVFSNLVQFIFSGNRFGGLSGVVFGVLGYVWIYGQVRKTYPLQLREAVMYMMIGWMLIGFSGVLDNVLGPMANEAHLAGLVGGALLGLFFGNKDKNRKLQAY